RTKSFRVAQNPLAAAVRQVHRIEALAFHLAMVMALIEPHLLFHGPAAVDFGPSGRGRDAASE
ncbi:MAG: hypothetical protein U0987_17330, partial [Afipia sp.]|nr:hypothetical protein [Afipia sp.]